jgi:hypothetical protein
MSNKAPVQPGAWLAILILLAFAPGITAQPLSGAQEPRDLSGWRLYNFQTSATYGSTDVPAPLLNGFPPVPSNVFLEAYASLGWFRTRERATYAFHYSPSFVAPTDSSRVRSFNQQVSANMRRQIASKWTWNSGLSGSIMTFEQFLLSPGRLSRTASVPSTFDDFANSVLHGTSTNPILDASNSASILDSPAAPGYYGQRFAAGAVNTGLSYSRSSRMTIDFGVSLTRAQRLGDNGQSATINNTGLTKSTMLDTVANISYSLSPTTTLVGSSTFGRTYAQVDAAYIGLWDVGLNKTIARRWIVSGHAGAGITKPAGTNSGVSRGPQYIYGGSVSYKTYSHTFTGAYERTLLDPTLAAGGQVFTVGTAAWVWSRPGRSWWTSSSYSHERQISPGFPNINTWDATFTFGWMLSSEWAIQSSYAFGELGSKGYVRDGIGYQIGHNTARLAIIWSPNRRFL